MSKPMQDVYDSLSGESTKLKNMGMLANSHAIDYALKKIKKAMDEEIEIENRKEALCDDAKDMFEQEYVYEFAAEYEDENEEYEEEDSETKQAKTIKTAKAFPFFILATVGLIIHLGLYIFANDPEQASVPFGIMVEKKVDFMSKGDMGYIVPYNVHVDEEGKLWVFDSANVSPVMDKNRSARISIDEDAGGLRTYYKIEVPESEIKEITPNKIDSINCCYSRVSKLTIIPSIPEENEDEQ